MYPSKSSPPHTWEYDPALIAALADTRGYLEGEEINPAQTLPDQQAPLPGLQRRRSGNAGRLNAIARNIGSRGSVLREMVANRSEQSTDARAQSQNAIGTIRHMIGETGICHCDGMSDEMLASRLDAANLSPATFIAAMRIVQTSGHPTLTVLGITAVESQTILHFLVDFMSNRGRINAIVHAAGNGANNNPDDFIAHIFERMG